MGFVAWLFDTVWGRRCLFAVVILVVAFVIREHYVRLGEQKAIASDGQQHLQDTTKAFEQDHKDIIAELKTSADVIQQATAAFQQSQARERQLANALISLAGQKKAADAAVAQVPDSELRSRIVSTLNVRRPGDVTPGYEPGEERSMLQCLTDQPMFAQQATLLQNQVGECRMQVDQSQKKGAAVALQYAALADYTNRLQGDYVTVYNALASKKRAPQCLWLWHCVRRTINAPKPSDLALPSTVATKGP
jgi:uncharacterized membrane-anchored protein YhcB (DUF1043 family)